MCPVTPGCARVQRICSAISAAGQPFPSSPTRLAASPGPEGPSRRVLPRPPREQGREALLSLVDRPVELRGQVVEPAALEPFARVRRDLLVGVVPLHLRREAGPPDAEGADAHVHPLLHGLHLVVEAHEPVDIPPTPAPRVRCRRQGHVPRKARLVGKLTRLSPARRSLVRIEVVVEVDAVHVVTLHDVEDHRERVRATPGGPDPSRGTCRRPSRGRDAAVHVVRGHERVEFARRARYRLSHACSSMPRPCALSITNASGSQSGAGGPPCVPVSSSDHGSSATRIGRRRRAHLEDDRVRIRSDAKVSRRATSSAFCGAVGRPVATASRGCRPSPPTRRATRGTSGRAPATAAASQLKLPAPRQAPGAVPRSREGAPPRTPPRRGTSLEVLNVYRHGASPGLLLRGVGRQPSPDHSVVRDGVRSGPGFARI